ncbi:MAG: ornithine cyclodeaminase family protein [Acidimicrobiales bacterium]
MPDRTRFFSPSQVAELLPWDSLIQAIETVVLEEGAFSPARTVHVVPDGKGNDAAFLLKPGWVAGDVIAVKAVTFFPDNGELGLATINAGVLLFSGADGTFLGACDGNELTTRRTAAASAVAAKRLAREDAKRLLVVGTGALSPMVAQAHSAVRDFDVVEVWGRSASKAAVVVDDLRKLGLVASVSSDLDSSVARADVVTCVTGSTSPLIKGALLLEGSHVDLIGAFTPEMRETDDDVMAGASIFVDTRDDGMLAGDLAQPLASGVISPHNILADLRDLVAGDHPGRASPAERTLFKSAGFALEDVAAARLVFA